MLVASSTPTTKDMECAIDRGTHVNKPLCWRAALSCGLDSEHVKELRASVTRLRDHLVAKATLAAEHGKIMQTGKPGHHSLWLRAACLAVAHTMFKVQS